MNLNGLSRLDLIRLVRRLATERNRAREAAAFYRRLTVPTYHSWTSDEAREHAQAILNTLDVDPDAEEHRAALWDAVYLSSGDRPAHVRRDPQQGPRCTKGKRVCGKPLDRDGLCSRHDARKRRAIRDGVAA